MEREGEREKEKYRQMENGKGHKKGKGQGKGEREGKILFVVKVHDFDFVTHTFRQFPQDMA